MKKIHIEDVYKYSPEILKNAPPGMLINYANDATRNMSELKAIQREIDSLNKTSKECPECEVDIEIRLSQLKIYKENFEPQK